MIFIQHFLLQVSSFPSFRFDALLRIKINFRFERNYLIFKINLRFCTVCLFFKSCLILSLPFSKSESMEAY